MLPEKRKRLIIGIISVVVIIIVVLLLGKLSAFIKNKNNKKEEITFNNDSYTEMYDYIGISMDKDGIYKVYGISKDSEKYLDIKTFYEVEDVKKINEKIVLYSDAVNEIRYDKEKDLFYFYELDSYYNKNVKALLTDNYLITMSEENTQYKKYGEDEFTSLEKYNDYLIYKNEIYYVKESSIYIYNIDEKSDIRIVKSDDTEIVKLLQISDNYLFYLKDNVLNAFSFSINFNIELMDLSFYNISSDGFLSFQDGILQNYSVSDRKYTYSYILNNNIENIIYLNNNMFYISYDKNYVIIDIEKGEIWKSLENEYLYLMKVK